MTQPFSSMDEHARVFYSRLFTDMMMNIHATRLGLFPVYLCETDNPFYFGLWHEQMPKIGRLMFQKLKEERDGLY